MLKLTLRLAAFALTVTGTVAVMPAAYAQSAKPTPDEAKYKYPGPETEWQIMGMKEPNQVMLVRRATGATGGMVRVQMLFLYSPANPGYERIDNYYTVDCKAQQLRDDGGTVWLDGEYRGQSPSETHSQLEDAEEGTVHAGIIRFACEGGGNLGDKMKRDAAVTEAIRWLTEQQAK